MKNKLLPIALLCMFGLTACGNGNNSESSVVEESKTKIDDLVGCTVTINNKEALKAEWHAGQTSRSIDLSVNPNCNVAQYIKDGLILITSSNENIVKVSGKLISAVGPGTAKVTVQYGSDGRDEVELTILDSVNEPETQIKTVSELVSAMGSDGFVAKQYKYKVTGYITRWQDGKTDGTQYGNFYIADTADGKNELYVYGASATMSIDFLASGLYSYTQDNKDFLTHNMTKNAMIGAKVELEGIAYFYNTTKEFTAKILSLTNPEIIACESVSVPETLEIETQASSQLTATVLPANCNQKVEWSSDNTAVATVSTSGLVIGIAAGTANITVKVGEKTDTCAVTVTEPAVKAVNVDEPVVGKQYKLGLYQENLGKKLYSTGTKSGNYGVSTEEFNEGALFELVEATGGYNVKVTRRDETTAYLNVTTSNNGKTGSEAKAYVNIAFDETASTVWTFDTTLKTLVTEISSFEGDYTSGNGTYYIGTYNSNTNLSCSLVSKASTSFVSHFMLAESFGPTKPVEGQKYPFALYQANKAQTLYMTTEMDGYYVKSTANKDESALAEIVTVEGGYNWKLTSGETVKYVNLTANGDHVNITVDDNASTVWTWSDALNTLTTEITGSSKADKNGTYYVGTFGTNVTFSGSLIKNAPTSFVGHFYDTIYTAPIAAPLATAIVLDKETASVNVGENITLNATLTPASSKDEIVWVSSDETIATVVNGKVTGVAVGQVTITAKVSDEIKAECVVTVAAAADKLVLDFTVGEAFECQTAAYKADTFTHNGLTFSYTNGKKGFVYESNVKTETTYFILKNACGLWNTTATTKEISKIVVYTSPSQSNTGTYAVTFGTSAVANEVTTGYAGTFVPGPSSSFECECNVEGATYFNLTSSIANCQCSKIEIFYK